MLPPYIPNSSSGCPVVLISQLSQLSLDPLAQLSVSTRAPVGVGDREGVALVALRLPAVAQRQHQVAQLVVGDADVALGPAITSAVSGRSVTRARG